MNFRLLGSKPLSEPILVHCYLDSLEQSLWNLNQNNKIKLQEMHLKTAVVYGSDVFWCIIDNIRNGTADCGVIIVFIS